MRVDANLTLAECNPKQSLYRSGGDDFGKYTCELLPNYGILCLEIIIGQTDKIRKPIGNKRHSFFKGSINSFLMFAFLLSAYGKAVRDMLDKAKRQGTIEIETLGGKNGSFNSNQRKF